MHPDPHIVLIGLRGCGKSTLGDRLAGAIGRPFLDLDRVVAQRTGTDGPGAFISTQGIDRFREEEAEALRWALTQPPGVLALGGGTPTAPGAPAMLQTPAVRVFYLCAQPATLAERLKNADNTDRPALVGPNPISEIETLLAQRDGLYRSLSESIVHVDGVRADSVLAALVALARAGA